MKLKTIIKSSFAAVLLALTLQSCADSKKEEKIAPKVEAQGENTKAMKCAPGKCGGAMQADKTNKDAKKEDAKKDTMKCGAGKCGDAMKEGKETK